jgi:ABC-type uncharacterized transport system permease subunit
MLAIEIFSVSFFVAMVLNGITLLFGCLGETIIEKAGHLNLGIPGIMYLGGIGAILGAFIYESNATNFNGFLAILCALFFCILMSGLGACIYAVLTVSLRANQNVTGLALTTFGVGLANFLGGSLGKLAQGGSGLFVSVKETSDAFTFYIPWLSEKTGLFGKLFFNSSYGFLTFVALILAVLVHIFFKKTSIGLNLKAVGENPQAADAAGINVTKYKYVAIMVGGIIAGLGGCYFVMNYLKGVWQHGALGDAGWLAVALVIFSLWRPLRSIWGAFLFGALTVAYNYLHASTSQQEILKMLPYLVTIIVLIVTSLNKRREDQPPRSLGLHYFREER